MFGKGWKGLVEVLTGTRKFPYTSLFISLGLYCQTDSTFSPEFISLGISRHSE
jgi:hypothetical protein